MFVQGPKSAVVGQLYCTCCCCLSRQRGEGKERGPKGDFTSDRPGGGPGAKSPNEPDSGDNSGTYSGSGGYFACSCLARCHSGARQEQGQAPQPRCEPWAASCSLNDQYQAMPSFTNEKLGAALPSVLCGGRVSVGDRVLCRQETNAERTEVRQRASNLIRVWRYVAQLPTNKLRGEAMVRDEACTCL